MPSAAPSPLSIHNRHSPHHTIDLGSQRGDQAKAANGRYTNGSANGDRYNDDEDEDSSSYEIVKTYESNESVLPTYSPSSRARSRQTHGAGVDEASMDSPPRKYGVGSFDPYAAPITPGEDKVAEKTRLMTRTEGEGAGAGYGRGEKAGMGRYAKLIPEQRPPRAPVSVALTGTFVR